MRYPQSVAALLAPFFAISCEVTREAASQSASVRQSANSLLQSASRPTAPRDVSPVKVDEGVYVGGRSVEYVNGDPLPARLEQSDGITLTRHEPMSLRELAALITRSAGIPVTLPTAPGSAQAAAQTSRSFAEGPVPQGFTLNPPQRTAGEPTVISASIPSAADGKLPLRYSGKLSGLLDLVGAHFNLHWRHADGKITFERTLNKSFDVPALPVVANLSFTLGAGSATGDGRSGASSAQAAATSTVADLWNEINGGLSSIIGSENGNGYAVSMTAGIVNVSADPATLKRVAAFLGNLNERLGEQVAISVKVYSVALRDKESFDFDIAGLLTQAGRYGVGVGNAVPNGAAPTPASPNSGLGWALLDTDSGFGGTNALVQALSERGEVSVLTSASVTTLNGIPVPLQVAQERDFVSKIEVTAQDGATTTDIVTDTVTAGFNLHLVPRLDRNGELSLQYGINISELAGAEDGFDTFTANEHTVQLRRVNQRNFVQQARIPNRKTLVLAGFEQVRTTRNGRGVPHPLFPALGGGGGAALEREIIVIAITPTVLAVGRN